MGFLDQFFSGTGTGGIPVLQRLLSSPVFGSLAGFKLGGAPFAIGGGLLSADLQRTEQENLRADEQLDRFMGLIEQGREDTLATQERFPSFLFGGDVFGGPEGFTGQSLSDFDRTTQFGGEPIDLSQQFNVGATREAEFRNQLQGLGFLGPEGGINQGALNLDFGTLREDMLGALRGGLASTEGTLNEALASSQSLFGAQRLAPGTLFDRLQATGTLPETDLSEVLSGRLAGIEATGASRQQQRQEEVAALSDQFGGLENLRRQQLGIGFEEAGQRGLEASTATAQTRMEELAAQQINAEMARSLTSQEAQLNFGLTGAQANLEAQLRTQLASAQGQFGFEESAALERLGIFQTQLDESNIQRNLDLSGTLAELSAGTAGDQTQAFAMLMDLLSQQTGTAAGLQTTNMQSILGEGGILQQFFGQNIPQLLSLTDFLGDFARGGSGQPFGLQFDASNIGQ